MRVLWLLALSLAACSPYSFPKEVGAISTGVDQLSSAYTAGSTQLAADRAARTHRELLGARSEVGVADSCFVLTPSAAPCVVVKPGDAPPALSAAETDRAATTAQLGALKDYADALAAVTNAGDRTAYDAAVAQLSGSVGGLADAAGPAAAAAGTVAPAVVNLVGWIFGTALDEQRFDSLKASVNAVGTPGVDKQSAFGTVAKTVGVKLFDLRAARRGILAEEAVTLQAQLKSQARQQRLQSQILGEQLKALTPPEQRKSQLLQERLRLELQQEQLTTPPGADYQSELGDLEAVVAVLDGVHQTDPKRTADALIKAHDALRAAVNDPSRNYASLLKAIGDLADQTAALQAALAAAAATSKAPAPAPPANTGS